MRRHSVTNERLKQFHFQYSHRPRTISLLQPVSRYVYHRSPHVSMKGVLESSQEVRCFTITQEQLNILLPPHLPHKLAVRAVEDILDQQHLNTRRMFSDYPTDIAMSFNQASNDMATEQNKSLEDEGTPTENAFDSGIFSEPASEGKEEQSIHSGGATQVLEKLDTLEKKVSAFTLKSEQVRKVTKSKCSSEEQELRQMLFRKLSQFRDKKCGEVLD